VFYTPDQDHGLPRDPFNALIVPRPIGWISSLDTAGRANLAPYSFFNAVAYDPPQVMFAATGPHRGGGLKDSVRNIEETGEFVVNLVTWDLRHQMAATSVDAPSNESEFDYAGLKTVPSRLVKVPRVAAARAHLECVWTQTVDLLADADEGPNKAVFGRVVGIHIDDRALKDGLVDTAGLKPVGRLGYDDYTAVGELFSLKRPSWNEAAGAEGS
jgi:flavin reductase (DIM6/NTAB) family NADH-FMN oxidoreductase RutF